MPTLESIKLNFSLPEGGNEVLANQVAVIKKTGLAGITKPGSLSDLHTRIDGRAIRNNLPPGTTEDDVIGVFKLSLLTECATESFSDAIVEIAKKHKAGWLKVFSTEIWKPDELTHFEPYKQILMSMGFSEEELDQEIDETREKEFTIVEGMDPVQVTSYGLKQEYLAGMWHGIGARVLNRTNKEAAAKVLRVQGREGLHRDWYEGFTGTMITLNPGLIANVAAEIPRFGMPGEQLAPELQAKAHIWQKILDNNPERAKKDLIELTRDAVGGMNNVGEMIIQIAKQQKVDIGPIRHELFIPVNRVSRGFLQRLLAEALMESAGLGDVYKEKDKGLQGRIRASGRTFLAQQIDKYISNIAA